MKLWAIIVTYKTPEKQLSKLIKQLNQIGLDSNQVFIKDNTKKNIGFSKAVNQGLKIGFKKGYQYFLLLNPDVSLQKISLSEIKKGFCHFNIFGGVFKQNNQIYTEGILDPVYLSGGLNTAKKQSVYYHTTFVSGSLMFIDRQTINKIQYLDERFFMYYEDVDYCYRAKKNHLKVGINSKIRYLHFETSKKNQNKYQYLKKSHQLFLKKYGTWWQKIAYWIKHKND